MKNILVIGGSYFAGRVCVETLAADPENRVYIVNRGNRPLAHNDVTEIICDRHDTRLIDVIPRIHWHALIDFCAYTPLDVVQLFLAVPHEAVGHYIFVSTTSVYADTLALPVTEDALRVTAPQPELGIAADYGYNKCQAEEKTEDLCRTSGIPYTILRPTIIYGKYNYAPRESWFFDVMAGGKAIALPKNELALYQFVFVWDVARAISLCMGNAAVFNDAYNLAAEDLVSYRRFVRVLEDVMDRNADIYALDSNEIDAQQIPLPFPLEQHLVYSGAKIVKALSFSYTAFLDGMRETWQWYVRQKGENRHG
jgi:2'-hydroxyisoflavone reductase